MGVDIDGKIESLLEQLTCGVLKESEVLGIQHRVAYLQKLKATV